MKSCVKVLLFGLLVGFIVVVSWLIMIKDLFRVLPQHDETTYDYPVSTLGNVTSNMVVGPWEGIDITSHKFLRLNLLADGSGQSMMLECCGNYAQVSSGRWRIDDGGVVKFSGVSNINLRIKVEINTLIEGDQKVARVLYVTRQGIEWRDIFQLFRTNEMSRLRGRLGVN